MKKRILALVLALVMTLLSLVGCSNAFDFAEEDLTKYATFNYEEFKAALQNIEIEDGDFTTNEETRQKKVVETIYNALADAIIAAAYDSDKVYSGELGDRDVLYYVYYAVDEKTGNVYFTSDMQESAITSTSTTTKNNHFIKLGAIDLEDKDADEFKKLIKENLVKEGDLADYVYSMLTKDEITKQATDKIKEENKDATEAQIADAVAEALKVKAGDKIVISYSVSYPKVDGETSTVVNESAAYETIVLDPENPFHQKFLDEQSVAKVGGNLAVFDSINESGEVTTTEKDILVKVTAEDGTVTNYTYNSVKILWKVEDEGKVISTFKYTPYKTSNSVTPDNLRATSASKVDLKDVELTYYVYPVYALSVPAHEDVDAALILNKIYGSKLVEGSFEVFEEAYKNGDEAIADLVAEIAKIYDTEDKENDYYKEGSDLKNLLIAYNNAKTLGGDKPSTADQELIDKAKENLTKAQREEAAKVVDKIVAAVKDGKTAGEAILEEYNEDTYHSLKETYDNDITEKVQAAIWKLIEDSVKVTAYPEKLVEKYEKHLYDTYEYEYYAGDFDSKTSNYDKYADFDAYLVATLKVDNAGKIDAAINAEAKAAIETMIKVFVVAKACEADALKVIGDFVESDIKSGAYDVDEHAYEETYGDAAAEKIEEAKKNADESIKSAKEDADKFLIDDAYMKAYKKEIGRAYYNSLVTEYGEDNLRTSFQFNKLFYYLASTNLQKTENGGHHHTEPKYVTKDGVDYIDFRTVTYKIVEAEESDEAKD